MSDEKAGENFVESLEWEIEVVRACRHFDRVQGGMFSLEDLESEVNVRVPPRLDATRWRQCGSHKRVARSPSYGASSTQTSTDEPFPPNSYSAFIGHRRHLCSV